MLLSELHSASCYTVIRHLSYLKKTAFSNEFFFLLSTTQRIYPKYGGNRLGCIFFVYTGTRVLWIVSENNFCFFINNIS